MNAFRRANLNALQKRRPGLADLMAARAETGALEDGDGKGWSKDAEKARNIIFAGLSNPRQWTALLDRKLGETAAAILVEPDPETFSRLLNSADLTRFILHPGVRIIAAAPPEKLFAEMRAALLKDRAFLSVMATAVHTVGPGFGTNPDYFRKALTAYRDAAMDLLYAVGNSPHDSFLGIMHMLKNLDTIAREPGVDGLFGAFRGKPAIIVAAGPSLDKNIHLLKDVGDRAVILSVDAMLKTLVNMGVSVDFATVLERVNFSPHLFTEIPPEKLAETVQVSVPVVVPEVYSVYPGPKALMYRPYGHFQWLEKEKGTLETGASSANMAFKLAEAFGCDPIILVGQDLAYGRTGTTHSDTTPWGRSQNGILKGQTNTFEVPANDGGMISTNGTWNMFRLAFEADVASFNGTVINATEGGALIAGTRIMTLEKALGDHLARPFDKKSAIRSMASPAGEEEAGKYLSWIFSEKIPRTVETIRNYGQLLGQTLAEVEKARAGRDTPAALKALTRAEETYKTLEKVKLLEQALLHVVQPEIVKVTLFHHDLEMKISNPDELAAQLLDLHRIALQRLSAMADKMAELYENTQEAVASDLYRRNLEILSRYAPALSSRIAALPGTGRIKRVPAGKSGWKLVSENGSSPEPGDAGTPETGEKGLPVVLGLDVGREFVGKLEALAGEHTGLVLVERDLEIFRHFLHAADLEKLAIKTELWMLAGDMFPRPLVASDQFPGERVITSADFVRVEKDSWGYRADPGYYEQTLPKIIEDLKTCADIMSTGDQTVFLKYLLDTAGMAIKTSLAENLRNAFTDSRAIVLLENTSDAEALEVASSAPAGLLVIATENAAQKLLRAGKTPHIAVATADPAQFPGFEGYPEEVIVAHPSYCHKGLWAAPIACRAVLTLPDWFFKWITGNNALFPIRIGPLGSVAADLASLAGVKEIAVAGAGPLQWGDAAPVNVKWDRTIMNRLLQGKKLLEGPAQIADYMDGSRGDPPVDIGAAMALLAGPSPERREKEMKRFREELLPDLAAALERKLALTVEHMREIMDGLSAPALHNGSWYAKRYLEPGTYEWESQVVASTDWYKFLRASNRAARQACSPEKADILKQEEYLRLIENIKNKLSDVLAYIRTLPAAN